MKINDKRDYYSLLNIPRDATSEQIRTAHRKLAKVFHPDMIREEDNFYNNYLQSINGAKDILLDKDKRAEFDHQNIQSSNASQGSPAEIGKLQAKLRAAKMELDNRNQELTKSREQLERAEQNNLKLAEESNSLRARMNQKPPSTAVKSAVIVVLLIALVVLSINTVRQHQVKSDYSEKIPFIVEDMEFANSEDTSAYTKQFDRKNIRYINPRLMVTSLLQKRKQVMLQIKFIKPDGTVSRYPAHSKEIYSYTQPVWLEPGQKIVRLNGWGNKSKSMFPQGQYGVEIWCDNRIMGKSEFMVQ